MALRRARGGVTSFAHGGNQVFRADQLRIKQHRRLAASEIHLDFVYTFVPHHGFPDRLFAAVTMHSFNVN